MGDEFFSFLIFIFSGYLLNLVSQKDRISKCIKFNWVKYFEVSTFIQVLPPWNKIQACGKKRFYNKKSAREVGIILKEQAEFLKLREGEVLYVR